MSLIHVSDTFTRLANTTAYADGDLVANHGTAGSVVPLSFAIGTGGYQIVEWRVVKSVSGVTNADFDLFLYDTSPTPANGDNGAFSTDVAGHLARLAGGQMVSFTDGGVWRDALDYGVIVSGHSQKGVIYGLLEAQAAYTPGSAEVFTVHLEVKKL